MKSINPINKQEEKRKFFFDTQYNPQFAYPERIVRQELEEKFGSISDEFLPQAQSILDTVIKEWGSESAYLLEAEGETMSKEQVQAQTKEYIRINNLEGKVQIRFVTDQVSPGSMIGNTISFRLPIGARSLRLEGTLNHEIGTHYFRRINEEQQPWAGNREKYDLVAYQETEEGLATLHSHLFLKTKYMWFAALYYVAVYQSNQMTFVQLYDFLKKYIDDRDRRWNITLRAKRGITDTSIPGAIAKDQVYLRGVVRVLRWLERHDYDPTSLYYGKIDAEDVERVMVISPKFVPVLPVFLNEGKEQYEKWIKDIRKQNMLEKI